MDETLHLNLPFIMPSQAQKHVTHNEALLTLDAVVQLAVLTRDQTAPPAGPSEGDRHVVAASPTGPWTGHGGAIASFADGAWRFFAPEEGWLAWVVAESQMTIHRGGAWRQFLANVPQIGVNASPDMTNRLTVSSDASLFNHAGGDHQLTINKASAGSRASIVFQDNFSGRAEIGLVGGDDLLVKVSANGSDFIEAVHVGSADGDTRLRSLNSGPLAGLRNAVVNGEGRVNQRGFAGGSLTGYGYDRWKAEGGGCSLTISGGQFALTGSISQTIEHADLAGSIVTASVESPSHALGVSLGSQSGTIPAGSGRQSATLTLGGSEPDDLKLVVTAASATTFSRVQVERGPWATPFERRPPALEEALCRRYFEVGHALYSGPTTSAETYHMIAPYAQAKRGAPTVSVAGVELSANAPSATTSYSVNTGLSSVEAAHVTFVATATNASSAAQVKILADAEF